MSVVRLVCTVFCLCYFLLFPLKVILANAEYLHIRRGLYPSPTFLPLLLASPCPFQLNAFARHFHMGASTLAAQIFLGFLFGCRINHSEVWNGL